MPKIEISYHDNDALTVEEIVKNNKRIYGSSATVKVFPESNLPHDLIQFALWQDRKSTRLNSSH